MEQDLEEAKVYAHSLEQSLAEAQAVAPGKEADWQLGGSGEEPKEKKQGQHAGWWMPKCAKLSEAYQRGQWNKCGHLIEQYKYNSPTFRQLVDGWRSG